MNENKQNYKIITNCSAAHMKGKKLKLAFQASVVQTSILANSFVVLASNFIVLANSFCSFG
jgi:hypothetical protein